MKLKKLIALLIASVMTVSALTACGNETQKESSEGSSTVESSSEKKDETQQVSSEAQEESNKIVFPLEETMTFTGFARMYGDVALDDNLAWQTMLEYGNIEFELTSALTSDADEKRNLLLSSGEYPDVFIKASMAANVDKYGMEGIFIPLEDLIREYAPNLTALLDANDGQGWKYISADDGHVYSIPQIDMQNRTPSSGGLWINKVWLDNLGLEIPTSMEDVYDVMVAFKEQDANGNGDPNDEIPYPASASHSLDGWWHYGDILTDTTNKIGYKDGKVINMLVDERYKEHIAFFTKVYDEELTTPDFLSLPVEQYNATGQTSDVYGMYMAQASFQVSGRERDTDYVMVPSFTEGTIPYGAGFTKGCLSITDKCENPEVIVAWIDYLFSEEGSRLAWMGVEGVSYEWYEDGTWGWIYGDMGENATEVRRNATMFGGAANPSYQSAEWYKMSSKTDADEVYLNEQRALIGETSAGLLPVITLTDEENKIATPIKTDAFAYAKEYRAKVITGELKLEESWDDYVKTMENMGINQLTEIYQAAYERWLEK